MVSKVAESEYQRIQVALDNHVLHRSHCLLQQIRVGGVGVVNVYLLLRLSDQVAELVRKKFLSSFDVVDIASVVWEHSVDGTHATCDLFAEEIDFVKEEDKRGFLEVFGV